MWPVWPKYLCTVTDLGPSNASYEHQNQIYHQIRRMTQVQAQLEDTRVFAVTERSLAMCTTLAALHTLHPHTTSHYTKSQAKTTHLTLHTNRVGKIPNTCAISREATHEAAILSLKLKKIKLFIRRLPKLVRKDETQTHRWHNCSRVASIWC